MYFPVAGSGFQDNYIDFVAPQSYMINTPVVWITMMHLSQKRIFKYQV